MKQWEVEGARVGCKTMWHVCVSFRKALVDIGWAISLLPCLQISLAPCRASTSRIEGFQQSGLWLFTEVLTIEILLMSGCSESHKSPQGSCKGTCVKFGA